MRWGRQGRAGRENPKEAKLASQAWNTPSGLLIPIVAICIFANSAINLVFSVLL